VLIRPSLRGVHRDSSAGRGQRADNQEGGRRPF